MLELISKLYVNADLYKKSVAVMAWVNIDKTNFGQWTLTLQEEKRRGREKNNGLDKSLRVKRIGRETTEYEGKQRQSRRKEEERYLHKTLIKWRKNNKYNNF